MDSHPTDTIGMPMTGQSQERRVVRLAHGAVVVDHATLLDGIDFELAPQAVTGLVGPNGAGKSTLLKVLARQQALTSGACFVDGLASHPWDPASSPAGSDTCPNPSPPLRP